ncbi:MAG TPA: hypothetical protein VIF37_03880 [Methylobacter sp.]|jgi:hypothetical protein
MKRTQKETAQPPAISMSRPKCKVVSFRLTEEQHALLVARCNNSHGESLMTPSEYARYTVLHQRIAQPSDVPLERYRLAIAAQLATAVTDTVQYLDQVVPVSHEKHVHGFQHVCDELAKIQKSILLLLSNTDKLNR